MNAPRIRISPKPPSERGKLHRIHFDKKRSHHSKLERMVKAGHDDTMSKRGFGVSTEQGGIASIKKLRNRRLQDRIREALNNEDFDG